MVKAFAPMLAGTPKADSDIRFGDFGVLASPKLDGVRAVCKEGTLLSRSLKLIPNKYVQQLLSHPMFQGLDGELTVGPANHPNVMQTTMSGVMAGDKMPQFQYHVFDRWDSDADFSHRLLLAENSVKAIQENWLVIAAAARLEGAPAWLMECPVVMVPHERIMHLDALNVYEAKRLADGYEGVMVRDPFGAYKFGRSTVKEGGLLKLKRFVDGEFIITGFVEEQENTNAKTVNELGRSKRSTHAAGKVGKSTLGAFVGKQLDMGKSVGPEFNVGTGMDAAFRKWAWENQDKLLNQIGKFKHFDHGTVDAPRHPVWLGLRDEKDMS